MGMGNKKERILISGGLGRLGIHFVRRLNFLGEVTVIDNLKNSNIQIAAEMEKIGVNILLEDVRRRKKACKDFDIVFHLAAHIDTNNSNSDPISDASNNILGTIALIKNYPTRKFIYFSSDAVYGQVKYAKEDSRPDPIIPYGFSKLGGEVYVRMLCKNYLILRIAENINLVDNLVEDVMSLVERDIKGTINIGNSNKIDCSKLKDLLIHARKIY